MAGGRVDAFAQRSVVFARSPQSFAAHDATPLISGMDLWFESRSMRHCAYRYAQLCRQGEYLLFSIRNRADPRERVTAGYEYSAESHGMPARWKLEQLRARYNREPPGTLWKVAQTLAECLNDKAAVAERGQDLNEVGRKTLAVTQVAEGGRTDDTLNYWPMLLVLTLIGWLIAGSGSIIGGNGLLLGSSGG
jgi:hypothetical protein